MITCAKCGAINHDDTIKCAACGTYYNPPAPPPPPAYSPYTPPVYTTTITPPVFHPYLPSYMPGYGYAATGTVLGILSCICFGFSWIFGLASIVFFVFGWIGSILAIVFGGVAKSKGYYGQMATAGIVLGISSIALFLIVFFCWYLPWVIYWY